MAHLTDADCESIHLQIRAAQKATDHNPDGSRKSSETYRFDGLMELRQKLLPTMEAKHQYITWSLERSKQAREPPQPPTAEEYFNRIKDTNFANDDSVAMLCNTLHLELHPHVGLGTFKGYHYCLRPIPTLLEPLDYDIDYSDTRKIVPDCMLGINLVKQDSNRQANRNRRNDVVSDKSSSSNASSSSNKSTGNDSTGFTFVQLGRVDMTSSIIFHNYRAQGKTECETPWVDTGFVLCVQIQEDGSAGAVWLLYNFRPYNDEDERVNIERSKGDWGRLPHDDTPCVGMKIGNSISDISPHKEWDVRERIDESYQSHLVAAVVVEGRVLR
jgi:hypothetical protein